MPISEDQLTTWAKIGAQATSQSTYATIKLALEDRNAGYANQSYSIFLQGSYRNDTNIYKESDVDVVIMLDSIFYYDLSPLSDYEKMAFTAAHPGVQYNASSFRNDVMAVLANRFGEDAVPGTKAVAIQPYHNRRKADVLIAIRHKKYRRFTAIGNDEETSGICFFKADGTKVVNYPKLHRTNLAAKNQQSNEWMKHVVRILKNARQRMIELGLLKEGVAPSYYLECLMYNVPTELFGESYMESVIKSINWLLNADRSQLVCANGQYRLLDDNPDVSWNSADCNAFLLAFSELWRTW